MTKKRASPVRKSAEKPNGLRRSKDASKANAERLHTRKIDPYAQLAALSPASVAELVGDHSETETNLVTETDERELQHGDTPMEEPQAQLRLDVGVMSLEDAGFGRQDGEEVPQKHMRALFDFHLSGQVAQQRASTGLPYFVQLVAWDLASGQATVLATDQSRLTASLVTVPVALQFPLPELGRYQLVGLVLLPDEDTVGVTLGDVFNVLP
jgi:hypothetical protein